MIAVLGLTLCRSTLGAASVVISQIYSAGGQLSAFPNADYVELFNRGNHPQDLTGWSVQVSAGSDQSDWTVIPLAGWMDPGQFYLVQVFTPGLGAIGQPLAAPDAIGVGPDGGQLTNAGGRVALVRDTAPLINTPCPASVSGATADFVAWGAGITCAEGGAPAPGSTSTTALFRAGAGCQDNGSNAADFGIDSPDPRSRRSNGFMTAAANPGNPMQGGSVTLLASQNPDRPCATLFHPIVYAYADASAIGGPATFWLDDAGGDDDAPGDGLYGATLTVPLTLPTGRYLVPVTASDGVYELTSVLVITVRPQPPANDYCPGAIDLGPLSSPFVATIDNSTAEPDAGPICGVAPLPLGVWYRITPAADGLLRLRETGRQDAAFSVYQTATCALPTISALVTCSGADDPTFIGVAAEQSYAVLVSSADTLPPTDPLDLEFTFLPRPPNDECFNAIDLGSLMSPYSATIDNAAALSDIDVTCNAGNSTRFGVWYTFVASAPGALVMTETSTQDAVFGVFTGTCAGLVPLATGGCFSTDNASVAPLLTAGTRYFVLVGNQTSSAAPPTVPLMLSLQFAAAPANDTCGTAATVTGYPYVDSRYAPQAGDDLPDVSCNAPGNTVTRRGVWYRILPGPAGRLVISETSSNDVVFALFDGGGGATCPPSGQQFCRNEAGALMGFPVEAGREYRLLVGLNSSTALPSLPYTIQIDLETVMGACCRGATCVQDTVSGCTGVFDLYAGPGTVCNTFGINNANPCCLADFNHIGGVSVQDVFDFLVAYFAGDAGANINASNGVSVQDIFDFLRAYFAGAC